MSTWTTTRPVPEDFNPRAIRDVIARRKRKQKPQKTMLDKFPVYADDPLRESHRLIDAFLREAGPNAYDVKPKNCAAGRTILETPIESWPAHLRAILARVLFHWATCVKPAEGLGPDDLAWRYDSNEHQAALLPLAKALLKRRDEIDMPEDGLLDWIDAITIDGQVGGAVDSHLPAGALLDILQRRAQRGGLTPALRDAATQLRQWRHDKYHAWGRDEQQLLADLDELLGRPVPGRKDLLDRGEPWAEAVLDELEKSGGPRTKWESLLRHCADSDASKPTNKWLASAKKLIDAVGADTFRSRTAEWLALAARPRTKPLDEGQRVYGWNNTFDLYSEKNESVLKGVAWACAAAGDGALSGPLGSLAEWCYTKIRLHGPRSPKVGNACLAALIALPGQEPRAELSRLKAKVKQPTARKMIEKALGASAARAGMTADDLEELAVTAYGLTEVGQGERKLGGHTARTRIAGTTKVELTFTDANGKSRASVPAELRSSHAAEVAGIQQSAKELGKMLAALRDRLERMPINRRELPMSAWRERYLDHPVVGTLARRLIWEFVIDPKRTVAGAWLQGKLVDAGDKPLVKTDEATVVRLWHPAGAPADDVVAWRAFLQRHQVTQPFKQAHREVYILTDAERQTRTYSNRFAAHILRQNQFAALCTQRGWKYRLMGTWDGGGDTTPTLLLPRWELRAEFWLTGGGGGDEDAPAPLSAVSRYVFTDQVRFYEGTGTHQPMPLDRVPPLAFSEVMRDVDLFVGVASVGNDPNWVPAGNRVGDYWQHYSFGELGASAQTRRDVLQHLLPRLKIASRATLTEKFLVVRGDLRTYKIHLGSGNILMEPNDQYLCIVPDRSSARSSDGESLFLPFEGDSTLSLILSKAMLLAGDTKITDSSITRQINR